MVLYLRSAPRLRAWFRPADAPAADTPVAPRPA